MRSPSFRLAATVKQQYGGGDTRSEKEGLRKSNHGIQYVFFNQGSAYLPFAASAEEDTMRHDNGDSSFSRQRGLDHVKDERIVTLRLRRNAARKPTERIAGRVLRPPLVEA